MPQKSPQRETEKLFYQNVLEISSSKVAKLNHKIRIQEVLTKHFQGQVNDFQCKQESLISQNGKEIVQDRLQNSWGNQNKSMKTIHQG